MGPLVGGYRIRAARLADAPWLSNIEDRAGAMYDDAGIDPDLPGLMQTEIAAAIAQRLTWVIVDEGDDPIAFALCWRYPEALHLRELDVDPTHMRRGLGRHLIEHVRTEAGALGLPQVTLTTFSEVPWNAPLYERYGFREVAHEAQPAWLRAIRTDEDAGPLRAWPRIAMAIDSTAP